MSNDNNEQKTLYIASNNCLATGHSLGDMICFIRTAWLFVQNEPHDRVILSLNTDDPLNFLWYKFIAYHKVHVINDPFDDDEQRRYRTLNARISDKRVRGILFHTYKELYPRLDAGERQEYLCDGEERGLGHTTIFEYMYYGQQTFNKNPVGMRHIDDTLIYHYKHRPTGQIFIAPEEKCQENRFFTPQFWVLVIKQLLSMGYKLGVNSKWGYFDEFKGHPNFESIFPPVVELLDMTTKYSLMLSGNTGTGWVAAATGTPLIALEQDDMNFPEYNFVSCGVNSLVASLNQADPDLLVAKVTEYMSRIRK
jgi:hypothetical protein